MKIYDFPLAFYPPRATLAAAEKGIEYDKVTVNLLTAANMKPDFLAVSPAGTLPCLVDGNRTITSSREIVEYLDSKDGRPLGGADVDRGAVATWMDRLDAWNGSFFAVYSGSPTVHAFMASSAWYKERVIEEMAAKHPDLREVYERQLERMRGIKEEFADREKIETNRSLLISLLSEAEEQLDTHPYIAGSAYTAADILFTPILHRVVDMGKEEEYLKDKPNVKKYFERVKARPSYHAVFGKAKSPGNLLHLVLGGMMRISIKKLIGV